MMQTETRQPRNGVNVPVLFATLDAVKSQKELAKFRLPGTVRCRDAVPRMSLFAI